MGIVTFDQKKYDVKSLILSRNKLLVYDCKKVDSEKKEKYIGDIKLNHVKLKPSYKYVILIKLFSENNPHCTLNVNFHEFEFENISVVSFKNFGEVNFLSFGNDIVINDLKDVDISIDDDNLLIIKK